MHVDLAQVLSLLIGVVLPLVAGLVTRWTASPGLRAVVLLALSAVTSVAATLLESVNAHRPFDIGATLLTVLGTFLVGTGTHFGLWKPTGVSAAVKATGGFIGTAPTAGQSTPDYPHRL